MAPPEGHVAVVAADYDATLERLRAAGFEADPRPEHWGSPRSFVRSPGGHRVELMAEPPHDVIAGVNARKFAGARCVRIGMATDDALRRREFLARTASLAGLAGAATLLPAGTLLEEAAAATRSRRAVAAQPADRPLRRRDDGEPLVRPLLRLARRRRRRRQTQTLRRRRDRRAGRHPPRVVARGRVAGLRPPRSRPRLGAAAARSCSGGFLADGSGNDEFALTYYDEGELEFIHAAAQGVHGLRPLLLLAARLDVAEPLLQVVGAVGRAQGQQPAGRDGRQPVGDDLRPRARPRR